MTEDNSQLNDHVEINEKDMVQPPKKQPSLFGTHFKKWAEYSIGACAILCVIYVIMGLLNLSALNLELVLTNTPTYIIGTFFRLIGGAIGLLICLFLSCGLLFGLVYALIRCIIHNVLKSIEEKQKDKSPRIPVVMFREYFKKWAKPSIYVVIVVTLLLLVSFCIWDVITIGAIYVDPMIVIEFMIGGFALLYVVIGILFGAFYSVIRCLKITKTTGL